MPFVTINTRLRDAESDTKFETVPLRLPTGLTLAQIETWFDAYAPELDATTGSVLVDAHVIIPLTLPGGLKTDPVALTTNERGGLIVFTTDGTHGDSFRIPNILFSLMPGQEFDVSTGDVADLVTRLTTTTNASRPVTADDFQYVEALKGKKSRRKK